jgi:hypothetical protein
MARPHCDAPLVSLVSKADNKRESPFLSPIKFLNNLFHWFQSEKAKRERPNVPTNFWLFYFMGFDDLCFFFVHA